MPSQSYGGAVSYPPVRPSRCSFFLLYRYFCRAHITHIVAFAFSFLSLAPPRSARAVATVSSSSSRCRPARPVATSPVNTAARGTAADVRTSTIVRIARRAATVATRGVTSRASSSSGVGSRSERRGCVHLHAFPALLAQMCVLGGEGKGETGVCVVDL